MTASALIRRRFDVRAWVGPPSPIVFQFSNLADRRPDKTGHSGIQGFTSTLYLRRRGRTRRHMLLAGAHKEKLVHRLLEA